MLRSTALATALLLCLAVVMGCSSGGANPVSPTTPGDLSAAVSTGTAQDNLWGYFDVYIDLPAQTVTANLNRTGMFSANVVSFLTKPTSLGFPMLKTTPVGATAVDVDLDVSITHPLPDALYNGYDVRGIFIGDSNGSMKYDSGLKIATAAGTPAVQFMHDYNLTASDPHTGTTGNPDGYTRWWNPSEFTTKGVVGYTPGLLATKGYTGTATLNPYKYFADGLNATDDAGAFLVSSAGLTGHGVFKANTTLTRNYYLRFPLGAGSVGVKFNYAVLACWTGEANSNAREAVTANANVTPDIYFVNNTNRGGDLKFDVDLYGWGYQPSSITVESNLLTTDFVDAAPAAIDGGENFSTYHEEATVAEANITSTGGNEFWVIAKYDGLNYNEGFGNAVPSAPLAAFFRYDLYVSPVPYNKAPVIDSGIDGNANPALNATAEVYSVTAHDDDPGDTLTYTWHVTKGGTPVTPYDGTTGTGLNTLTINYSTIAGLVIGNVLHITCAVSDGKDSVNATPLDATASCPVPVVASITPNSAWAGGNVNITGIPISSGWMDGASVAARLFLNSTTTIPATAVVHSAAGITSCTFNLTAAASGNYVVQVQNQCGTWSSETGSVTFNVLSCGTPTMPSTDPSYFTTSPPNEQTGYFTKLHGTNNDYYCGGEFNAQEIPSGSGQWYYNWGIFARDGSGSILPQNQYQSSLVLGSAMWPQGLAATTNNHIYMIMTSNNTVLYSTDWSESTGFSNIAVQASMPSISPYYFYKLSVDNNDHPVALVYQWNGSYQLAIRHWTGTAWNNIPINDSASIIAANGGNLNYGDFAYNPASGYYFFTSGPYYNGGWQGSPKLYVINSNGNTVMTEDLYPTLPNGRMFGASVYVDQSDPNCRTLVMVECQETGSNRFGTRVIRYNPFGGEKTQTDMNLTPSYINQLWFPGFVGRFNGNSNVYFSRSLFYMCTMPIPSW